jgi:hypothetical protein
MERALARMPGVIVPEAIAAKDRRGTRLVPIARLMIALAEDSIWRGDNGEFFISQRDAAKYADQPSRETASNRLVALHKMGYLSRIDPGASGADATGKAAVYRWHDPPIPGRAVWVKEVALLGLTSVYDEAEAILATVEVPAELVEDPEIAAVARAILAIRAASGCGGEGEVFGASFRAVANLAGLVGDDSATVATRRLGILCRRGYVTLVEVGFAGTGGQQSRPSQWLWHDPPIPGEATWAGRSTSDGEPVVLRTDDYRDAFPFGDAIERTEEAIF